MASKESYGQSNLLRAGPRGTKNKDLSRYRGINVGWKKNQRHIGHFLVLVEYISIALSHERKKFINQFFSNYTLKCLNVNGS